MTSDPGDGITLEAVPRLCDGVDLQGQAISPEEGFLLSRIDGASTVEMLASSSGLGVDQTIEVMKALNAKGVLIFLDTAKRAAEAKVITDAADVQTKAAADAKAERDAAVYDIEDLREILRQKIPKDDMIIPIVTSIYVHMGELSYYDLLDIDRKANAGQVKKAYLLRTKSFHPDRFFRKADHDFIEKIQEIFKQINKGFKVLSDPEARKEYDEALGEDTGETQRPAREEMKTEEVTAQPKFTRTARVPTGGSPREVRETVRMTEEEAKRRKAEARAQLRKSTLTGGAKVKLGLIKGAKGPAPAAPSPIAKQIEKLKEEGNPRLEKAEKFFKGAQAEMNRGNFKGARVNLQLALQYDPNNKKYKETFENLGKLEEEKQAETEFKAGREAHKDGNLTEALRHYKESLRQGYEQPQLFFRTAELLMEVENNFDRARMLLIRALEKEPDTTDFLLALARAYKGLGKTPAAAAQLEKVLQKDPKNKIVAKELKALKRG